MKILFVIDQYCLENNGMTISARRFAKVLREMGHEVRIISTGNADYPLKEFTLPIFAPLIAAQGMVFAKPDNAVITEALNWADVAHIYSPFALSHRVLKLAKQMNKPVTGAFHVQPENITSSIHMGKIGFVNTLIYRWFRFYIYRHCNFIHCPSQFIANQLKKHGYRGRCIVISNGIDEDFVPQKTTPAGILAGKLPIMMIGRYSIEKRQDLLIDAVKKSKHEKNIQLILAGAGPRQKQLAKQAQGLTNPVIMHFFTKQELLKTINMCTLYVHCSDFEIEAMSCMEAFACGLVPVIANSPMSATPQFALDERSLFAAGDSDDLAAKIDYWLDHEPQRKTAEQNYIEKSHEYSLQNCVLHFEQMLKQAVEEQK